MKQILSPPAYISGLNITVTNALLFKPNQKSTRQKRSCQLKRLVQKYFLKKFAGVIHSRYIS